MGVVALDQPQLVAAQNSFAWLLATHPDESLRDGEEALRWAQRAVDATGGKVHTILDTLAAARYASVFENFENAADYASFFASIGESESQ